MAEHAGNVLETCHVALHDGGLSAAPPYRFRHLLCGRFILYVPDSNVETISRSQSRCSGTYAAAGACY